MNHYETVFILNPVLSDDQVKETVQKFYDYLVSKGAEMISKEDWGLKKMAYPIQKKKTGFFHLFEYKVSGEVISPFEAVTTARRTLALPVKPQIGYSSYMSVPAASR